MCTASLERTEFPLHKATFPEPWERQTLQKLF